MLREVPAVQVDQEPRHRWFAHEYFDLVLWLSDLACIVAFELCYDKPRFERAMIWSRERGYEHFRVDAGEETPMRNRTPILVSDGSFPKEQVIARFTRAAGTLDPAIRALVLQRLREFPS